MKKQGENDYYFENVDELLEFIKGELCTKEDIEFSILDSIENGYIGEFNSPFLHIDKSIYDKNQKQIDEALNTYGEKRKKRILDMLDNKEEIFILSLNQFTYSKEFVEKLLEYDSSLINGLSISETTISKDVLNLLLENNIKVYAKVQGEDKFKTHRPRFEFSRDELNRIKKNHFSRFNYVRLLRASDDEIKEIMTLPVISIYNSLENNSGIRPFDTKMNETNRIYLESVFEIVSRLRKSGYNGIINIESKNIYDFSETRFRYANLHDCRINMIFRPEIITSIEYIADKHSEYFKDSEKSLEDKIRKGIAIAVSSELLFINENQNISYLEASEIFKTKQILDFDDREINRIFLENYIQKDFIYDFFRYLGIQTIKYINDDNTTSYFIYDSSTQKFIEFKPSGSIGFVKHYYELIKDRIAIDDPVSIFYACSEIAKLIPDVINEKSSTFQTFLSCSLGEELYSFIEAELKKYISDSINEEKKSLEKVGLFDDITEEEKIAINEQNQIETTLKCVKQCYFDLREIIMSISPTYKDDKEKMLNLEGMENSKEKLYERDNQLLQEKTKRYYLAIRDLCDRFINEKRKIIYRSSKVINGQDRFQITPLHAVNNALPNTTTDKTNEVGLITKEYIDKKGRESND